MYNLIYKFLVVITLISAVCGLVYGIYSLVKSNKTKHTVYYPGDITFEDDGRITIH